MCDGDGGSDGCGHDAADDGAWDGYVSDTDGPSGGRAGKTSFVGFVTAIVAVALLAIGVARLEAVLRPLH